METLSKGKYTGQSRSQYKMAGLSFTRCFFPKAFNSNWHSHENAHITFTLRGGSVEQRKKGNIECAPGLLLLYPAGELHRNTNYVCNTESFSIEFENEWCKSLGINSGADNRQSIIKSPLIKHKVIEIMRELKWQDAHSELAVETMLLNIFSMLPQDNAETKKPAWVKQLHELLHDEPGENHSLAALSLKLNVHPVNISKYFPHYFKTTLGDYIRKIKTERSLAALCKKSISLEDVAAAYGFVDNAHYTRVFKKHTGITPSQYRKLVTG